MSKILEAAFAFLGTFLSRSSLKNLQLIACFGQFLFLLAIEVDNIAELLIGDTDNAHRAFIRHIFSDALFVNVSVFKAGAMAHIHRVLVHREAVGKQKFPKGCVCLFLCGRLGWQIEGYNEPHRTVSTKVASEVFTLFVHVSSLSSSGFGTMKRG